VQEPYSWVDLGFDILTAISIATFFLPGIDEAAVASARAGWQAAKWAKVIQPIRSAAKMGVLWGGVNVATSNVLHYYKEGEFLSPEESIVQMKSGFVEGFAFEVGMVGAGVIGGRFIAPLITTLKGSARVNSVVSTVKASRAFTLTKPLHRVVFTSGSVTNYAIWAGA